MKLITVDNYQLSVADEALLVKPIRKLWNQDRTKGKEKFYQQMSILFYVYSPASNFVYISDEKKRLEEVLKQEGITEFHDTADFKQAVEAYKKLNETPSTMLLQSTLVAIDKVRDFLEHIDLNKVDDKGKPIYTINNVVSAIKQIPQLSKDVQEAIKSVNKELEEQSKTRGDQELTIGDLE